MSKSIRQLPGKRLARIVFYCRPEEKEALELAVMALHHQTLPRWFKSMRTKEVAAYRARLKPGGESSAGG